MNPDPIADAVIRGDFNEAVRLDREYDYFLDDLRDSREDADA